jgi:hypothetical protein
MSSEHGERFAALFAALKDELLELLNQLCTALEDALFVRMTDEQENDFEERRKRIYELCATLRKFNKAA